MLERNAKSAASAEREQGRALYDRDLQAWAREQAALARLGRADLLDLDHIAEEIESLGRSEESALESAYRLLCLHLLKRLYQPERATRSWEVTIVRERNTIIRLLKRSPGLISKRDSLFSAAYADSREEAAAEIGLPLETFPPEAPFTREQAEDKGLMLEAIRRV